MKIKSKILIIAGSDSSGGAGIQADIKTVTALGGYAMTAVTAVTSQNTKGVKSVVPIKTKEIERISSSSMTLFTTMPFMWQKNSKRDKYSPVLDLWLAIPPRGRGKCT